MADIAKLRKCSDPTQTIWITGQAGDFTLSTFVVGRVVKLINYSGVVDAPSSNFAPAAANTKLGIGNSTYTLSSNDCWQCVQVEDSTSYDEELDPNGPWLTDGGIVVNGFTQVAAFNSCTGCVGTVTTEDTCNTTSCTTCGSSTSTSGCTSTSCCQSTDVCVEAPPSCGDECDDCHCEEVMPSQCVVYNGPAIPGLGITPGMNMNSVVALIGENILNINIDPTCSDLTCSNNKEGCKNPLDIIFKPFFDYISEQDIIDDPAAITSYIATYFDPIFLDAGIILSNSSCDAICCQECCEDDFYFLGAAQLGFILYELTKFPSCCANTSFSSAVALAGTANALGGIRARYDQLQFLIGGGSVGINYGSLPNPLIFGNTSQCCTDGTFAQCVQDFNDAIGNEPSIVDYGVVESQYANNASLLCSLVEYLNDTSVVALSIAQKIAIATYFIEQGLVISCCNEQIYIGGVDPFVQLITNDVLANCIPNKVLPTFTLTTYCVGDPTDLPTPTSNEGITGSWVETSIDTSSPGTYELTFIPDSDQNAYSVVVRYTVTLCE